LIATPTEARRYLWSWFAFVLLGAITFLVFVFSQTPLFLLPGAPAFIAGFSLNRQAVKAASRIEVPRDGFWATQLRTGDLYNVLVGREGFDEAVSRLHLRPGRWTALRQLTIGILLLSLGIVAIRILVFQ
jgi:hypothetical protein